MCFFSVWCIGFTAAIAVHDGMKNDYVMDWVWLNYLL